MLLNRIVCVLILTLVFTCPCFADEPIVLRVLSYNIHHAAGTDGKLDLERIAQVISAVKPDIVALQEVDQKVTRTGNVDQIAELARLTKMNFVFGANIELQGGHYGNAVLTRFDSIKMKNHPLPQLTPGEQRGVIEADIGVPGMRQPLKFLATHFDHRSDDAERLASAKAIGKLIEPWKNRPAILTGDLNATPNSDSIKHALAAWTSANSKHWPTIPSDSPQREIDYILFRPQTAWEVVEFRVLDEAVASDHRAILAVLKWNGASE